MIKAEHRPFVIAIILSLAVHIGFGVSGIIRPTPKLSEVKTPTIVMRQFSLEQAPPAVPEVAPPPAKPKAQPKPKQPPKVAETVVPVIEEKKETEQQPEIIEHPEIQEEKSIWTVIEDESETMLTEETVTEETPVSEETAITEEVIAEQNTQTANTDDGIIRPKTALHPQFPNSAKLKYEGPMSITGTMNYQRDGQNYTIYAAFHIPFNKREFEVSGTIDGNNLIPHTYIDKRKGKVYASAVFDRENGVVRFGQGEEPTQSTDAIDFAQTPAYDLFSWAWQVAINGGNMPDTVWVTNGKKIYEYDTQNANAGMKESVFDTGEGKLRLLSLPFEREGSSTEYEFSFAPDFANVPAIITMTADGKKHTVHLIRVELDGKKQWQAIRETGVRNKD